MGDSMIDAFSLELMRLMQRRHAPAGSVLDLSAFRLAYHLSRIGPSTAKDLAESTLLDQSTVSRQVSSAIQRGWLERTTDESGAHLIVATPAGAKALEHDLALRGRDLRAALAALDPQTQDGLVAGLRAYNDAFDALED